MLLVIGLEKVVPSRIGLKKWWLNDVAEDEIEESSA